MAVYDNIKRGLRLVHCWRTLSDTSVSGIEVFLFAFGLTERDICSLSWVYMSIDRLDITEGVSNSGSGWVHPRASLAISSCKFPYNGSKSTL